MVSIVRQAPEPGFEIIATPPSNMLVLYWNHAFAGYWPDHKSGLFVSNPHWAPSEAATRSPEAANPAWVLRGMKLDVVKNLIKDYERNENA